MFHAVYRGEDDPCHHVAESDVGGHGDGPASAELGIQDHRSADVDERGSQHATHRCHDRERGLLWRGQRSAWQHGLTDFLPSDEEEERHEDVVHDEVEGVVVCHRLVGMVIEVRPHESKGGPDDQEDAVLEKERDGSVRTVCFCQLFSLCQRPSHSHARREI